MQYTVNVTTEEFPQPSRILTEADYITFIVNRAAESYRNQYGTDSKVAGIAAACAAFNAALPPPPDEAPTE